MSLKKIIIPAVLAVGAGVSYVRRKFYEKEDKVCPGCEKEFEFLKRPRYSCDFSGDVYCSECLVKIKPRFKVAKKYEEKVQKGIEEMVMVKSVKVPGYRTVKILGRVHSAYSYRNRSQAREDLYFQALKSGANGVLEMEVFTENKVMATSVSSPVPGLSLNAQAYAAEGIAAIVERLHDPEQDTRRQIEELERLSRLFQEKSLTSEEFQKLKEKVLLNLEDDEEENFKQGEEESDKQSPESLEKPIEENSGEDQDSSASETLRDS